MNKLSGKDLEEILDQISDDDLVDEIHNRSLEQEFEDDIDCYECRQRIDESESPIDEAEALRVYYAMHRGDMETVRDFVCRAAGRIA